MRLLHEDTDWTDLLAIVASATGRQVAFVEKDYWVTHTLWALDVQGFEMWFKGGEDRKPMPPSSHAAFRPGEGDRWRELGEAWSAIGPMYWGPRMSLPEATAVIRKFLDGLSIR